MKLATVVRAVALMGMVAAGSAQAASGEVQILSATIKDQTIANAKVMLQQHGQQTLSAVTDENGIAQLDSAQADSNEALLIVTAPGYSNLVVKCPCDGMSYALSPVLTNLDAVRIVLNWGERPYDLDSHIVFPGNHVYFSEMSGTDAQLDVDDVNGYGPETITLSPKREGWRYVYAVHDYSNRKAPGPGLSNSRAKVFVYVGESLVRTYYVPEGQEGNLWTVFAINERGEFEDYNSIKTVHSHERLQTEEFEGVISGSRISTETANASAQARAKAFNTQGEQAYQAKDYNEAILLFQRAIELDGNYGQAYSNLGLTFQKRGRVAEALWANRKAIALASGSRAATVRASSHYNNGRIYEDAEQWQDALREYQRAKQQKENPVYDKAIERARANGAR